MVELGKETDAVGIAAHVSEEDSNDEEVDELEDEVSHLPIVRSSNSYHP